MLALIFPFHENPPLGYHPHMENALVIIAVVAVAVTLYWYVYG